MTARRALPRLLLALLLAAAIGWVVLNRDSLDAAMLEARLAALGLWAPLAFAALYALGTVLFAPGALFALAGGALFGPAWGVAWNLAGATVGATAAFLVARYLAADWVARRAGGRLGRIIAGVEAEGWRFVALVRLVPLFPFNLVNYALGLTRIPLAQYVLATAVCMLPGAVAYTWLGHAGRGVAEGGMDAWRAGLLALGALALLLFLPRLVRSIRALPPAVAWTEPEALRAALGTPAAPLVLDVRTAEDFHGPQGHIPGAFNLPLEDLPDRLDTLDPSRPVVTVCTTDRRSSKAAAILGAAGFEVSVLRGGMKGWPDQE